MMNGYACRLEIAAQELPYVIGRMRADVDAAAYSTALSRAEGALALLDEATELSEGADRNL